MEEQWVREGKRWMGKKEDIAEGDQTGMLEEMGVEKSGGEEWMVGMTEKGLKLSVRKVRAERKMKQCNKDQDKQGRQKR